MKIRSNLTLPDAHFKHKAWGKLAEGPEDPKHITMAINKIAS